MIPDRPKLIFATAGLTLALAIVFSSAASYLSRSDHQVVLQSWSEVEEKVVPVEDQGPLVAAARGTRPEGLILHNHRVRAGENLWVISRRYGTTVSSITSANLDLSGTQLNPGMEILVPNQKGLTHALRFGQTLSDLSIAYNVSLAAIMKINSIKNPARIRAGHQIFIPEADPLTKSDPRRAYLDKRGLDSSFSFPIKRRRLTSSFGMRTNPVSKKREYHKGIDLAATWGSQVSASQKGEVKFAGWKSGYGRCVIIKHGRGLETRYGHLTEILVKTGSKVERGQRIAKLGNTGSSTGSHLHFEMRQEGTPINPMKYLAN